MKYNKRNFLIFINAIFVIIFSIGILFYPFFRYEFLQKNYKIKKLTNRDYSNVDFYEHSKIISNEIAENAIVNKFEFQDKKRSFEIINKSLRDIFSSYEPALNTQSLYIHSLSILFDLVRAHKINEDENYLKIGSRIIKKWYELNPRKLLSYNEYSWNDHSTAIRISAILYFWDYFSEYSEDNAQPL